MVVRLQNSSINLKLTATFSNDIEYIKIIQTVGAGFLVMGAIGYIVKLVNIR